MTEMTKKQTSTSCKVKHFNSRGSYICVICGKRTRDTGAGEAEFQMCKNCMEECEQENYENDHS